MKRFAIPLVVISLFVSLHAETYLSEAQAVKIAIPAAASVSIEVKQLTPPQRDSLQSKSGLRFPEQQYKCFVGRDKEGHIVGYGIIMNEIGKEEYITFIVGLSPKDEVNDVAIMEYRESRGSEVREKRFLRQFHGKKSSDPIQVNRDIANYTGATLSSYAVSHGVKKALLLIELFYLGGR